MKNGVVLIEYKLGSLKSELGAKIASVTSGHNVTCFDYEVMISPLFRWPDLVFHFNIRCVDSMVISSGV